MAVMVMQEIWIVRYGVRIKVGLERVQAMEVDVFPVVFKPRFWQMLRVLIDAHACSSVVALTWIVAITITTAQNLKQGNQTEISLKNQLTNFFIAITK